MSFPSREPHLLRTTSSSRWCSRQHVFIVVCTVILCFAFLPRESHLPLQFAPTPPCPAEYVTVTRPPPPQSTSTNLAPKQFVKGSPTTGKFRDALRPDVHYVTSFCLGGFTNQFMCFANLVYLGMISDRVSVIPPFTPSHHISTSAGTVAFGEVFDLDSLRNTLKKPLIEWADIKNFPTHRDARSFAAEESLGCWNPRDGNPSGQSFSEHLHLDVSYTQVPGEMFINPDHWHDHTNLWNVAALLYPKHPLFEDRTFPVAHASPKGNYAPPDRHLACLDTTYYMGSGAAPFEWERSWSPVWRYVATHIKFTQKVNDLADKAIRKAFKVRPSAAMPPFIAVHVRHGDFGRTCSSSDPEDCFAALPAFARRVEEVKQELMETKGLRVNRVLISSDDTTEFFWQQVEALGWRDIDHGVEQTVERHGEWYLPIIDVATHSRAVGFVGTSGSTLSLVSARRVENWSGGPTRLVNWGYKGADDH
ncbi:hypothetical protein CPB85DRAFT_1389006 [Mucidula mucida]|nr:hypothetical protein CPB85DRAFT_1389006 [Mucidula mucida]